MNFNCSKDCFKRGFLTFLIFIIGGVVSIVVFIALQIDIGNYFDCHIDNLTSDQLLDYFNELLDAHSWSKVKLDLKSYMIAFKEFCGMLSGLATLAIAVFTVLQYRIHKFGLKNELFDKRSIVYEGVKCLISTITDTEEFTLEDRNYYIQSIKGAKFFFKDKTIPEYVELLLRNALNVRKYTKKKCSG